MNPVFLQENIDKRPNEGKIMSTVSQIQEIYIGLLGRAADAEGLAYWQAEIDGGVLTIEELRANIVNEQAEYASGLGTLSRAQLVNTLYNNLFNRDAEEAGLEYWVNGDGSSVNADQLVLALSDGASASDTLVLDNRTTAATYYTNNVTTYDASEAASVISGVGSTTASVDAAKASVDAGTVGSGAGTTFVLTTDIDAVSGTSLDDTITGLLGTSGSYNVGDNVNGGSGTDVINLIAGSHTDGAAGLVSLDAVETVNIRLVGTATDTLTVNANDFSGVTTLSNASSLSATTLQVSGVELTTNIAVHGNTDVNVGFVNTSTSDATVYATLVSVGSDTTATTMGSASAAATANLDLDLANGGLLQNISVDIQGSANIARIEAGSNVDTLTLTGSGNAFLATDDTYTTIDASEVTGNIELGVTGASDVTVTMGAGDDTLALGTSISNDDVVDGGDGSDTLSFTIAGFNRNVVATNFETVEVTFDDAAGGNVSFSGSDAMTVDVAASTASGDAQINDLADSSIISITDDTIDAVSAAYVTGSLVATVNVGSSTGEVDLDSLTVNEAATVNLNITGTGADIAAMSFDSDVTAINITTSGSEANLEFGSGGTGNDMSIGGATALTFTTNGSGEIALDEDVAGGSSLTSITVSTNGATAASASLLDVSATGLTTMTLNASAADITVQDMVIGTNGSATTTDFTMTIDQGVEQDVTISETTAVGGIDYNLVITSESSGSTTIGDFGFTKGNATAIPATVTIDALTVGTGAVVDLADFNYTGAETAGQIEIGTITVASEGGFSIFDGGSGLEASAITNVDVGDLTLDIGTSASAIVGTILTTGGAIGALTIDVGVAGSARTTAFDVSAMGAIDLMVGSAAQIDIGAISAQEGVGAIELDGSEGGDITFGVIHATSIGAIVASGDMDVTFGTLSAATIGSIDASNMGVSGAFTIDLSGIQGAAEIEVGAATNTITSGVGNDVITLSSGTTGNDVIQYTATGQGTDQITNFFAGSTGADQIEISTAAATNFEDADGSAVLNAADVDLSAVITAAATTLVATDNVIVLGTAFGSTSDMTSFFDDISFATAAMASANILVAWTDGTDSYVTLVDADGAGSAAATTLASAGHTITTSTLATLEGVTPGALDTTNFDFIT